MRQDDFVNFMRATICKFEQSNSYGTAHIYKNSLSNLIAFYRTDRIPFKKITPSPLTCAQSGQLIIGLSTGTWHPISRDYSNKYIQVHVQIGKRH